MPASGPDFSEVFEPNDNFLYVSDLSTYWIDWDTRQPFYTISAELDLCRIISYTQTPLILEPHLISQLIRYMGLKKESVSGKSSTCRNPKGMRVETGGCPTYIAHTRSSFNRGLAGWLRLHAGSKRTPRKQIPHQPLHCLNFRCFPLRWWV